MNTNLKRFIVKTIGISVLIALIGWLVFSLFLPQYYLPILPYTLLFFLVVTILVHVYQLELAKKDLAKFTRNNMLITFFKLIIYSLFTIIYIALDSENALVFVICVMLLYIIYSFVEVAELTRISNKK